MKQRSIEQFEQGSPLRKISMLNRLNQNSLAGPLATIGITRGTLPFVMEVLRCEGVIQEDITKALSIDRAATARALFQLEKQGLVERSEDPKDRRRKRVRPTEKTRGMQDAIMDILKQQKATLFAGFDEQEQRQFMNMLDRMIGNMRPQSSA